MAACVRCQLLPAVVLWLCSCHVLLGQRTVGTITGTRIAGVLGVAIILECIESRAKVWKPLGFECSSGVVCVGTWVDNLYSFSDSVGKAIATLEDFEEHLKKTWGLQIEESSRGCTACKGCVDVSTCSSRWPLHSVLNILGHLIQSDCGKNKTIGLSLDLLYGNVCGETVDLSQTSM